MNNFIEKQKQRLDVTNMSGEPPDANKSGSRFSEPGAPSGINKYAVRSVLEAIGYTYGHVISPELPVKSMYSNMQQKPMNAAATSVPRLMFTIFNGGKSLGSKVKFSRFYLIMNIKAADTLDT